MDNANENINISYYRFSEKGIKKRNEKLWKEISEYTKLNITFKEKFYHYENNLQELPLCYCGNTLKFLDMHKGYRKFCSNKCAVNSEEVKNNKIASCLEKYGVTNPAKSQKIKEKVKKTNLDKFGVEYPLQSPEVLSKLKKDFLDKWGVDNPSKVDYIREKAKKTMLNIFGVEHAMQNQDIKYSLGRYFLVKYGVSNPSKLPDVREKARKSMVELYGVTDALKSEEFKQKLKATNLNRWGKEYFTQTDDYKKSIINRKFLTNSSRVNDENSILLEISEFEYLIRCLICNQEYSINRQLWRSRKRNNTNTCLKCNPITNNGVSCGEKDLYSVISNIYKGEIIENFRMRKELDIYLPSLKIDFEYNGLYWHSEAHKSKYDHVNKYKYFEENGISVFTIWEDDWLLKRDIVVSMIRSKIGKIENKIYARKCKIEEIKDNNLVRDFLFKNHIQGFIGSKVKIGLYYENELVSIMTFGELRKPLGQKSVANSFELLRYCNKINCTVVGGASKMLNYFLTNYQVDNIVSYSDNSRSIGDVYNKLGFECVSESFGNYYWYKNLTRYHRYTFRKDKLVRLGYSPDKTEIDIMHDQGYLRIWDYGQRRWERVSKKNS